jgi:hypothetical protein
MVALSITTTTTVAARATRGPGQWWLAAAVGGFRNLSQERVALAATKLVFGHNHGFRATMPRATTG